MCLYEVLQDFPWVNYHMVNVSVRCSELKEVGRGGEAKPERETYGVSQSTYYGREYLS